MSGSKMSLKKVKSTHHQNLFFDFSGRQFHNNTKRNLGDSEGTNNRRKYVQIKQHS